MVMLVAERTLEAVVVPHAGIWTRSHNSCRWWSASGTVKSLVYDHDKGDGIWPMNDMVLNPQHFVIYVYIILHIYNCIYNTAYIIVCVNIYNIQAPLKSTNLCQNSTGYPRLSWGKVSDPLWSSGSRTHFIRGLFISLSEVFFFLSLNSTPGTLW